MIPLEETREALQTISDSSMGRNNCPIQQVGCSGCRTPVALSQRGGGSPQFGGFLLAEHKRGSKTQTHPTVARVVLSSPNKDQCKMATVFCWFPF